VLHMVGQDSEGITTGATRVRRWPLRAAFIEARPLSHRLECLSKPIRS
jgi:hypothetical protein